MIAVALNAYAATTQRQFIQDRSQTVGASEVGRCARQTFFSKNEGDADYGRGRDAGHVDGWGARVRGSVFEDAWWAPAMKASYGERLLYAGSEQRTLVDGFLSATPDGLLIDQPADALAHLNVPDIESDCIAIECKSIDPRSRLDEAKPEHVFQVQVQLGLLRTLTNHRPMYGVISYTDASFWDAVHEFVVRFDPSVYAIAQGRARQIMTNPDFAAMPASALHVAFVAASELKKQRNNTSVVGGAVRFDDQSTAHKPPSASERQAAYDEFWGRKRA